MRYHRFTFTFIFFTFLLLVPAVIARAQDTVPPEDARNLTLREKLQDNGLYTIFAEWAPSYDSAGDLASYNLYESADMGKSFAGPTVLLGTVLSTTIANVPPGDFTLKLTAMDASKNESSGVMAAVSLPQTGAATLLISLIGASGLVVVQTVMRSGTLGLRRAFLRTR